MQQVTKRLADHSSGPTGILKAAAFATGAARAVADSSLSFSTEPQSTHTMSNDPQAAEQAFEMAQPRAGRSTADAAAGATVTTARWTAQLRPLPEQWGCASAVLADPSEQQGKASVGGASPDEASRTACRQPPAGSVCATTGRHNGTEARREQQAGVENFEDDESAAGTVDLLRSLPPGDVTELSEVHTLHSPAACSMHGCNVLIHDACCQTACRETSKCTAL